MLKAPSSRSPRPQRGQHLGPQKLPPRPGAAHRRGRLRRRKPANLRSSSSASWWCFSKRWMASWESRSGGTPALRGFFTSSQTPPSGSWWPPCAARSPTRQMGTGAFPRDSSRSPLVQGTNIATAAPSAASWAPEATTTSRVTPRSCPGRPSRTLRVLSVKVQIKSGASNSSSSDLAK